MKKDFTSFPFAPKRMPFFYGWVIVAMATFGILMSAPGQTYGVAAFTEHLINALGLSRVDVSFAYMVGTLGSAAVLTPAGKLYDLWGARVMGPLSALMMGIVLLLMSQVDRISRFISGVIGVESSYIPFATVLIGFFFLRLSGQGMLTMVSRNMLMKWFDAKRGFVMAISGIVIAPLFSSAPKFFNIIVDRVGWRSSWIILACVCGFGFSAVSSLFFRDNPEACGLEPDGRKSAERSENIKADIRQYTLSEAAGLYQFWVFSLSLSLFGLFMTGLSFHVASIFTSVGMSAEDGFSIFIPGAILSLVLRPVVGWACDRFEMKYLLFVMTAGVAVTALGLALLGKVDSRWIIIVGEGLSGSTFGTLASVTWPKFFGRRHLGAISGLNMTLMVAASAVGPLLFGVIFSRLGSYAAAGWGILAVAALLLAGAAGANNPQRQSN